MKPPSPGLHRFVNDSRDVAKVQLVIPAGDELEVSDAVAAQLPGNFKDPAVVPESPPQIVKNANGEVDFAASSDEALIAAGLMVAEPKKVPAKKAK